MTSPTSFLRPSVCVTACRRAVQLTVVIAGGWLLGAGADAQVIIRDGFSGGGDGSDILGRNPDTTNLTGATWQKLDSVGTDPMRTTNTAGFGNPGPPGMFGQHQSAGAISLASFGAYLKPTKLTISMDLSAGQVNGALPATVGPASGGRGIALGFFSSTGSQSFSQNLFTGVVVDALGNLTVVKDPSATGFFDLPAATIKTPVPYGGAYNPALLSTLSYDVDTTTGAITNIHFGSSTAIYTSLEGGNLFAGAATTFAGVYVSSEAFGTFAAADNFEVKATVPEPASIGLLSLGGLWVLGVRRRRVG